MEINLSALNQAPSGEGGSGSSTVVATPAAISLPLTSAAGTVGAGGSAETPIPSPACTPVAHSMSNSRSMSYATLPHLTAPSPRNTSAAPADTAGEQPVSTAQWEVVRATLRGDVSILDVGTSSSEGGAPSSAPRRSGVLAMLDAMGRLSIQHLAAQLGPNASSSGDERESSAQPAWYHYALQLPGQFLALSSLPMPAQSNRSSEGAAASPRASGEMLTACTLDGWTYFIPTLPMELPARPDGSFAEPSLADSAAAPFTLARFHFPARVSAFCSGVYPSPAGGSAAGALCFTTYQHELVLFPDALASTPLQNEWCAHWAWEAVEPAPLPPGTEEDAILTAAALEMIATNGANSASLPQTPAVPVDASAAPTPRAAAETSFDALPPVWALTVKSTRQTLLHEWREHDTRPPTAAAPDAHSGKDALQQQTPSLQQLVDWTTSARVPSSPYRRDSSVDSNVADRLAPYVRDLRSADLVLLQEYRALLRRRLGLEPDTTATEREAQQERTEEGTQGVEVFDDPLRASSSSHTPRSVQTPRTPALFSTGLRTPLSPALPRAGAGVPMSPATAGLLSPALSGSPLFSSFKLLSQHFPLRPLTGAALTQHSGNEEGKTDVPAAGASSTTGSCIVAPFILHNPPGPMTGEGVMPLHAPAAMSTAEKSPGFWRKLMRRTQ